MVTLTGIQGIRDNAVTPTSSSRSGSTNDAPATAEDRVDFSPEARDAAAVAKLAAQIQDSEIRSQKVEEAKRRIEEGAYKVVSIVNVVAERLSGIVAA